MTVLETLYDLHRLVHICTRNWLREEGLLAETTKDCIKLVAGNLPLWSHECKDKWITYLPHIQRVCMDENVLQMSERYDLLENISWWLTADGKYDEAVKTQTVVVQGREKMLGVVHEETIDGHTEFLGLEDSSTLASMGNLALTYNGQGRWAEAETPQVQVLAMRKRVLGEEHPDTLTSISHLASTLADQKPNEEAIGLMRSCVELRKKVLGPEDPTTQFSAQKLKKLEHNGHVAGGRKRRAQNIRPQEEAEPADHSKYVGQQNRPKSTAPSRGPRKRIKVSK